MAKITEDGKKQVKLVTLRQIIVVLIGIIIMLLTGIYGMCAGEEAFFQLSYSVLKGGNYMNSATCFLVGVIIFIFGLYDILKDVYFVRTLKHRKKEENHP